MPRNIRKNKKKRNIDRLALDINLELGKTFVFIRKKEIRTWQAVFVIALIAGFFASLVWISTLDVKNTGRASYDPVKKARIINAIKKKGCVFDGILNNYSGDTANLIPLLDRSQCQYVHRAVETWLTPPDFDLIRENMQKIKKPDLIYSLFISEAIDPYAVYFDLERGRYFNFAAMCQPGSFGFWGPGTCQANMRSDEYQTYVSFITRKAMDLGIDSFLFGQVNFQDSRRLFSYKAGDIVDQMRKYASQKNKTIVIGAQTGTIDSEKYLRNFDYIEGGVGLYADGETIDTKACYSIWPGKCWPMLWNEKYSKKANDVVIHLDWSGLSYDDMSKFARMDHETRIKSLSNLYNFFRIRNMGFLMPFSAVLYPDNGGCYGHSRNYYSADNAYFCRDEDEINAILAGGVQFNDARFVGQNIPAVMAAGEHYAASVTLINMGLSTWTREDQYQLGVQNPRVNNAWGEKIALDEADAVKPGAAKTFNFEVTAPEASGAYNFQWRMLVKGKEEFGDYTKNVRISVVPR